MTKKVKIVIPIYKTEFSKTEEISFNQCLRILKNFDIVIVYPEKLKLGSVLEKRAEDLILEAFPNEYFESIEGYNRLMLSREFYERFIDAEYILIYQLDCYVFKDELLYWCSKNYDYIGAPWIGTPEYYLIPKINRLLYKMIGKKYEKDVVLYKTGNGGFSLRKVEKFYNITKRFTAEISSYTHNEDVFWSLEAPKLCPDFIVPDYKVSVAFAIDRKPNIALKINKGKLPFGCHGFIKPKVRKFWKPIIKF